MSEARDPRTLTARSILIVAPHADDESLGCGGLAAILAKDGRQFHTLFVTDGGASHRNSATWPRAALAANVRAIASPDRRPVSATPSPRRTMREKASITRNPAGSGLATRRRQLLLPRSRAP